MQVLWSTFQAACEVFWKKWWLCVSMRYNFVTHERLLTTWTKFFCNRKFYPQDIRDCVKTVNHCQNFIRVVAQACTGKWPKSTEILSGVFFTSRLVYISRFSKSFTLFYHRVLVISWTSSDIFLQLKYKKMHFFKFFRPSTVQKPIFSSICISTGPYCTLNVQCALQTRHTVFIKHHIYTSIILLWSLLYITMELGRVADKTEAITIDWNQT